MKYWKCTVCGYIHEGSAPPDICPICRAGRDKFVQHAEAVPQNAVKQWKCTVCGYIHEGGAPPEKCPVCKALMEKFVLSITESPAVPSSEAVSGEKNGAVRKWKCIVCGYIHEGEEAPERCPVCKAVHEKFVAYSQESEITGPVHANIFDSLETAAEATKKIPHIKTGELTFDTYYFLPGQILDYHKHPTGDQIFITIQGTGEFHLDNGPETVFKLKPGEIVLAPKNVWHKIVNTGKNILIVSQATKQPAGMTAKNSR